MRYDPMFVIRIIALLFGALALFYTAVLHSYHFGPGLSSPVDLHIDIESGFDEKMKKEEPELYRSYEREKNFDRYESSLTYENDTGYCGDHGRDYQ